MDRINGTIFTDNADPSWIGPLAEALVTQGESLEQMRLKALKTETTVATGSSVLEPPNLVITRNFAPNYFFIHFYILIRKTFFSSIAAVYCSPSC